MTAADAPSPKPDSIHKDPSAPCPCAGVPAQSSPARNAVSATRVRFPGISCTYRYGTFQKETVMAKKLNGRVAVVTGASKGIGAEIARQLAAEGAAVVVNYATSKEGADRVVAEITARDGRAIAVQADMANRADIRRLFAETKQAF